MSEDDKVKLGEIDARCKSNTHQINELKNDIADIRSEQKAIYDISANIQVMTQAMGIMKGDIAEVKQDMKTDITEVKQDIGVVKDKVNVLENKPANDTYKNVNSIKYGMIWIVVAGVVGYLLGQVLPSINW